MTTTAETGEDGAGAEQEMVVHLYAPAEGPDAGAAYRALHDIWLACRYLFRMTGPVPATGLPHDLPATPGGLPAPAAGGEEALAAQERPGTGFQAVLRRHHDVLNLSVALAPDPAGPPRGTEPPGTPGWTDLDTLWDAVAVGRTGPLLGAVRLYLAKTPHRDPAAEALRTAVPAGAPGGGDGEGRGPGVRTADGLTLWETGSREDDRRERRFVVVAAAGDAAGDARLSGWTWSRGDTAVPPLARYLLHAAKVRYELRVWNRDGTARALRAALETGTAALAGPRGHAAAADAAALDRLRHDRGRAVMAAAALRDLHHTVEIAADNMTALFGGRGEGTPLDPGGPFDDDRNLARWLLSSLDDQARYLDRAAARAGQALADAAAVPAPPAPRDPAGTAPRLRTPSHDREVERSVFVVHGRDARARDAVFDFLRALDLRPLEWETLVAGTGSASPFLGDVVEHAVRRARAAVVLLTPDDVVSLHPALHAPEDAAEDTAPGMQARPNVLLELGMALCAYPHRTVILKAGVHRPVADLGGRNFVQLSDSPDCRRKIAHRLRLAGCRVDDQGQDWLSAGCFAGLPAYGRRPPAPG